LFTDLPPCFGQRTYPSMQLFGAFVLLSGPVLCTLAPRLIFRPELIFSLPGTGFLPVVRSPGMVFLVSFPRSLRSVRHFGYLFRGPPPYLGPSSLLSFQVRAGQATRLNGVRPCFSVASPSRSPARCCRLLLGRAFFPPSFPSCLRCSLLMSRF